MSAGESKSVGQYDEPFYESGPAIHSFEWDEKGTIYLSRVVNSIAKVNSGTGTSVLNAGNGHTYSWSGRCGIYDVTSLFKNNGGAVKYVDLTRYAMPNEELIRQDVFLIICIGGIFCPVNMDIW
jgi:hypothetical protein